MKYLSITILILLAFQSCGADSTMDITNQNENLLLTSVYGLISHHFDYDENKIIKISFVLEEMSIEKTIIYDQNDQIKYSINSYEFDDLSISVDTTFIEYQDNLITKATTQKYIQNFKINQYFQYDDLNRLINVRQERIFNSTTNLIYKFNYDQNNNVTKLDIPNYQNYLFEYDDKVNPYTQFNLGVMIILGEWTVMNVLSNNNTITETIIDNSSETINEYFEYLYDYNNVGFPIQRTEKYDLTTFYDYKRN